jgi:hypothetical protein
MDGLVYFFASPPSTARLLDLYAGVPCAVCPAPASSAGPSDPLAGQRAAAAAAARLLAALLQDAPEEGPAAARCDGFWGLLGDATFRLARERV